LVAQRIEALVSAGRLIAQGDISLSLSQKRRFSEQVNSMVTKGG